MSYQEKLMLDNYNLVYTFINKNPKYAKAFDSVEDMAQELLLKLWSVINKYKEEYKFSTFAFKVFDMHSRYRFRDRVMKFKDFKFISLDETDESGILVKDKIPSKNDLIHDIQIASIKVNLPSILKDKILNDLTAEEIAEKNNKSVAWVYKKTNIELDKIKNRIK